MSIEIKQKLCSWCCGGVMKKIEKITIHNTGNFDYTSGALNHATYQYENKDRGASWHYTVDNKEIWQSYKDNQICWHTGTTKGNETSVAIEICVNDKPTFTIACDNAAYLTAKLLKNYGLSIDKVVQHYDWNKKDCPQQIRAGNWGIKWDTFIDKVNNYLRSSSVPLIDSNVSEPS